MSEETPELITVLCDIIASYMDLSGDNGQVLIYNQKFLIPDKPGLFVYLSFMRSKPFGNHLNYRSETDRLIEVQGQNSQETYGVDLFSRDSSARTRNHEVPMAFRSTYCEQQQEKYAFRIGFLPTTFVDSSRVEGAARLNRYSLTFNVLRSFSKERVVQYYDQFQNPPQGLIVEP